MSLKLIKLTKSYEKQLGEMIDEWKEDQEKNHTNHSPWAIFKNDYHDFDYYLEHLELTNPRDGLVPDSTFFLLDDEKDRLLGAVNIRHYLNDGLLKRKAAIWPPLISLGLYETYVILAVDVFLIPFCKA